MSAMKKLVFSLLGLSVIGVYAVQAQTNAPSMSPSTSTTLTPPPDTAPSTTTSSTTTTTTTVSPPMVASPTPTPAPVVTMAPTPTPAPAYVAPHAAPPAKVVIIPPQSKRHAPRPYHLTPVSWIVATRDQLHYDDRYVTIIGHVTRRIGDDEYWFTDGTGSVRLDSENFDLPIGRRIVVGGRIDQAWLGFGHVEVDVRRWRYAN